MATIKRKPGPPLYIAGIGASAGGLEALQKLISHLPGDIKNIAFIIVQHLSPNYKSMLVESLSGQTKLKVAEIKNTVLVNAGTIYITPPDYEITIKKRKLYLTKPPRTYGPRPSIDSLFSSLSMDQKEKSIGIILSGTGSDGSIGIKAIKNAGGITIVQDPKSAKYNSMPLAAIESGMIDLVLTPEKIGEQLNLLTLEGKNRPVIQSAEEIRDKGYQEIIELLAKATGTDFSNYKHNTLYRRITKRLAELKLDSTKQYIKYIDKNPEELEVLYKNVLIGVTSFFRDSAVFRSLERKISDLVDSKIGAEALRVWIPGCATGEEAYSIGIVINSVLKKKNRVLPVQIFATDINEQALSFARKGIYQQKVLHAVPSEIIKNYFIRHNGFSEVSKQIRSLILFSKHDITHNPPFLKLDLIVCRNLLIYFNTRLQEYVFPVFYSALNPNGYLLLGKSESIGHFTDLFSTVNREAKIYQRKAGTSLHRIRYTPLTIRQPKTQPTHHYDFSISEMVKETVFKLFEHPYVVINDSMDIQEISGDVSRYLGLRQGQMNANLLKLAHKDLKIELRSLINKCISENKEAKGNIRKIEDAENEFFVRIMVRPLLYSISPNYFYLVVFEEIKKETNNDQQVYKPISKDDARRIEELELELEATKEDLQGFVERLENSNTELQSLNEEMQSTNEELKISNEELETANEELQSTNEEINIAYNELKAANEKLEEQEELLLKSDANIKAMLGNTMQAFILIDKDYRIISFNKVAVHTLKNSFGINISASDSFRDLLTKKEFDSFSGDFKNALKGEIISSERSITNKKGKPFSFIFNFTPVMNSGLHAESISFSMLDITELKKTKNELSKSEKLIDSFFHTADIGIALVNNKGKFVKVNDGFSRLLKYNKDELAGKSYLGLIPPSDRKEARLLQEQFLQNKITHNERKFICKDGSIIESYITNNLLIDDEGNKFIIKTIRDISETKKYKDLLEAAEKAVHVGGFVLDIPSNHITWTNEMYEIYELKKDCKLTREKIASFYTNGSAQKMKLAMNNAIDKGIPFDIELEIITAKKTRKWVNATGNPVRLKSKTTKILGTKQDITKRKIAELEIERLSWVASHSNNIVIITSKYRKIEWVNKSFEKIMGYKLKEVKGKRPEDLLEGIDTNKEVSKRIIKRLDKLQPSVGEVILNYTKEGKPVWTSLDVTPIFHAGELTNFIGVMTDITELIKAKEIQKEQEGLRKRKELLEAMARNFPDGIIGILDKNFKYVFAGGTEINKLGLTPKQLIGEYLFDSLSDKSNSEAEPFMQKAFNGENILFEEEIRGNIYAVSAVPLFFNENTVDQILVVVHNITNRKKVEKEILEALNKQKELNELKSKFVSIASHEFRTPLSGILSSVFLISKYMELQDNEKAQKHVDRITESVRSLTDILNDFLSLGKIEEGFVKNKITKFNVVEFCKSFTDEMQLLVRKKQTIIYHHRGAKKMISLDKQHLRHVLTNLISNSIKYSDEGKEILLTSSFTNGQIKFTVKDEGMGIPEEDQAHLSQTFFRANNVSGIQGTGMGLHIVKKYLDIMGGTFQFASQQNKGSTFTIQIPSEPPL
ncbi:MAG: PAS domain S-box protein [Bacteroidota bacterium]|nr:PAS domain S-box protein [Bacteroidota bacterium]